jgi:hypothetical protein
LEDVKMKECVILIKDDYDSVKHSLQAALIDIKKMGETYPCYSINRIEQLVEEAYDVLIEED